MLASKAATALAALVRVELGGVARAYLNSPIRVDASTSNHASAGHLASQLLHNLAELSTNTVLTYLTLALKSWLLRDRVKPSPTAITA